MKTGRMMPQINEEYGYEDHYPQGWGENRQAPSRSAATRARLAWEICLAGGYQTTGERADRGTGWGPDTGGGWINGRGDDQMTMLELYGNLYDFFTGIAFWKLRPEPDLIASVQGVARPANSKTPAVMSARSEKGDLAVVYLSGGAVVTLKSDLLADGLRPLWFSPMNGGVRVARAVRPFTFKAPDKNDWVLVLSVPCNCSFREHDSEFEK
jgi:hypothetical protein